MSPPGSMLQACGSFGITVWTLSLVGLLVLYRLISRHVSLRRLPPQPKGWPLVGNLPEVLSAGGLLHRTMIRWAREEGEIVRLELGPNTEYIINTDRACHAIFTADSAHSSERPFWMVGQKYITQYRSMDLLDASNPLWKTLRKVAVQNVTNTQRADAGLPFLNHETLRFIHSIANDPDAGTEKQTGLFDSIGRYVYSTFTSQLFGLEISKVDSKASKYIFESALDEITSTISGFYIADVFTFLDYLPLSMRPWARHGLDRYQQDVEFVRRRLERAEQLVAAGDPPDSFMTRVLTSGDKSGLEPLDLAYTALKLIAAASDTSRMSTWVFLEQMMLHPQIQEKARKIVDAHVGDRIPVWEDLESLPYIRYIMKEIWRVRPPVGNGLGHRTTKDIAYKNYIIPAGATVRPNIWAMGVDPNRYDDPTEFRPERWEGDVSSSQQSSNNADYKQRDHYAFGVGRRLCPGQQVADRSFATAIMRILWALDIKVKPGTTLPINSDEYMTRELPGIPGSHFPVSLKVREDRKELVDKLWEKELAEWKVYGDMDL